MKHFLLILSLSIIAVCTITKNNVYGQTVIEQFGKEEQLTDTFLHRLQQGSDIILIAAIESNSFGRNISYQILASKNGVWKGYTYKITSLRRQLPQAVTEVGVSKKDCEAAMASLEKKEIWRTEMASEKTKCNTRINDGANWHLFIITPKKVLQSARYEPQFYQDHCPNADRQLFVDASNKINAMFKVNN